jgi:DNA-binding NtrC family response regulator
MSESKATRILVADDQPDVLNALALLLGDEGYDVTAARSPGEALERLEAADYDLAILDLNYTRDTTSGQEGLDLMERIRAVDPTLPLLVMTAWSSVAGAVEAMRRGAGDYIEKPWDDERLRATVRTQVNLRQALRRSQRLQEANTRLQQGTAPAFIGDSAAMRAVRQTIDRVAPSDAAVLITGEHGTGKEVVATWLHARSERKGRPLVTMNAGGLAEGIAESELFGHVKGAFTDARFDRIGCFELADDGTLFLDEIANMPTRLQAKLLRVLQTGEVQRVGSSRLRYVNVRVLSATNADLPAEIAAGRFREDLLYRLNTVVIHLPPLRERPEDIEPLARHFLAALPCALPQSACRLRRVGTRRSPVPRLAGQRSRAGPQRRAGRPHGRPGCDDHQCAPPRPAAGAGVGYFHRRAVARASRAPVHRESPRAARRGRAHRRAAARDEPQRPLPPASAVWRTRIAAGRPAPARRAA